MIYKKISIVFVVAAAFGLGAFLWTSLELKTALSFWFFIFAVLGAAIYAFLARRHAKANSIEGVMSLADIARERRNGNEKIVQTRTGASAAREAIRLGAPRELRSNLYAALLRTSWTRFLLFAVTIYLFANVLFATAFFLTPGSIHSARPESFADAFYFSIQTMATIGYGVLYPQGDTANFLVILEALCGIAATALLTGMIVAKAGRPHAGVMFSRPVIISQMHGKPCLMFRVANTQGSEIISAEMAVSALRDEVSPEGVHLRRIHDLKLSRHRSPFFVISWLVIHEIDEKSPLYDYVQKGNDPSLISLICILTGHEGTYGQTIYAQHSYEVSDFNVDKEFVDIIGQRPDGRLVVNYEKFHDLKA